MIAIMLTVAWTFVVCPAGHDGGDKPFALPVHTELHPDQTRVFVRIERNFFKQMTLQQKPGEFDVLMHLYQRLSCCAETVDGTEEIIPMGEACVGNLKHLSAVDLTQQTFLWTLEEIKTDPAAWIDDSDAGHLLLQMAEAKAFSPSFARVRSLNCNAFYIPGPATDGGPDHNHDARAKLLQADLIVESKSRPSHFYITIKGSQNLQMKLVARGQQSLEEYHKPPSYVLASWLLLFPS